MNIALILSGGTGTRLGAAVPKQYIEVNGRPIISFCMERLFFHEGIDAVQIVADPAWHDFIVGCMGVPETEKKWRKFRDFSAPGETRQLSILNGLEDIRKYAGDGDYVLIHDAARPLLSEELITRCLDAAKEHEGALPVLPMKDTVYASTDGRRVTSLLKREEIYAGQAPEVFLLGKYYDANRRLSREEMLRINGSTEPAILAGLDIALVPGDEGNFKVTTEADLKRLCDIMGKNQEEADQ